MDAQLIARVIVFLIILSLLSAVGIADSTQAEEPSFELKRPTATDSAQKEPSAAPGSAAEAGKSESSETVTIPSWFPQLLGLQLFNGVLQYTPHFPSPYEGQNSFSAHRHGSDLTQTYGVYLGSQLAPNLQAYFDGETFVGNGISNGTGLGGYINGDVIRAGSSDLPKEPYVARLYVRYYYPLSPETEKVERGMDQIPGDQPVSRLEFKFGKLAAVDDFDLNRYANNNRTQFMNYDFLYNTAWDYASDTRGYSYGMTLSLFQPRWRLAFGMYLEPDTANGANFHVINTQELGVCRDNGF